MITRIMPAPSQGPTPKTADRSLPAALFFFASGNYCKAAPSMKHLPDSKEVRISVIYSWKFMPSDQDQAEMEVKIQQMLGVEDPPAVFDYARNDSDAADAADRFLTGARPEVQ